MNEWYKAGSCRHSSACETPIYISGHCSPICFRSANFAPQSLFCWQTHILWNKEFSNLFLKKKQTILALKSDMPLDISQKTKPFKLFSQMALVWFHMWLYFHWYCKETDPWSENISWWQWRRTTQGSGPYMGRQGMSRGGERWRRCHIKI